MPTLIYTPAITAHILPSNGGIIDISEDLVSWSLTLNENTTHVFQFKLQNSQRKYDGTFLPMDRIRVGLKRINWLQCFTGYIDTSPIFQAWPGTLDLSASCTLKLPMYHYWDPNTTAAYDMISQALIHDSTGQVIASTANGVEGISNLIIQSLTQVVGWNKANIHLGKIPDGWAKWANQVGDQINRDMSVYQTLGHSAVINGQTGAGTSSTGGNLKVNLPPGTYGSEALDVNQARYASILYNYINYDRQLKDRFDLKCMVMMCVYAESHFRNWWSPAVPESKNYTDNSGSHAPDADSVGLFQQRPSQGWGTPLTCMNPVLACGTFLDRLLKIAPTPVLQLEWPQKVQNVQRSSFSTGSNYEKFMVNAKTIVMEMDNRSASVAAGTPVSAPTSGTPTPTQSTGNMVGWVAWDLVKKHEAAKTWITYSQATFSPDTTPVADVKILDCSSLVDWVYYHAVGGTTHLWKGTSDWRGNGGPRSNVASIHSTIRATGREIPLELARWVRGAVLIESDGHIGVSLGDNTHVAAHQHYSDVSRDVTAGDPITGGGHWDRGGLLPGVDYSGSATTPAAAEQLKALMKYPSVTVAPPLSMIAGPTGDVTIGPDASASGAVTADQIYAGLINGLYFTSGANDMTGDAFGGPAMMENDVPFLPWLKGVVSSSMRSFCSAPNGDFIAWNPDYFGLWGTAAIMNIETIELQNFAVYWSDAAIVTHQFVLGNMGPSAFDSASGTVGFTAQAQSDMGYLASHNAGIATMDYPEIFQVLYRDQSRGADSGFINAFMQRFGARPNVEHRPELPKGTDSTSGGGSKQEFFYALYLFMQRWAGQFTADVPVTFMPELFPGMLLRIPEYGFQAYVRSVTHQGVYGQGGAFTTTVNICAPSTYGDKNQTTSLAWLPKGGQSL